MPSPTVAAASYVGGGAPIVGAAPVSKCGVQVLFSRPAAMQISYDVSGASAYDSVPIITPARQNFYEGGIYRLKITGVPGREGTELYPTLEIGPTTRRSAAYLAHNAIPIQFTEEDFDQVMTGNFVTKVIYLPDPEFQELALAGVETLVSTRLDPGLDPILEADRRGAILAVVRIGNKDMEIPGTLEALAAGDSSSFGGQVAFANYLGGGAGCDDGACGGCDGACGGGCGGSCGGAQSFYGPNSTPRGGHGPGGLPSALTGAGQYGMPITGTPIGLPGPPHVPLGVPAGLKKHVIRNWTRHHIPDPVEKLKINVKQRPGLSYPQPPNRAWVVEDTIHSQPHYSNHHFGYPPSGGLPLGGGTQAGGLGGGLLQSLKHKWGGLHH